MLGLGGWLPRDPREVERWVQKLRKRAKASPRPLIPPIAEFQQMVYADPVLHTNVQLMFAEACQLQKTTPLDWQPEPRTFEDFLVLLNEIMFTAPEAYQTGTGANEQAAGLIGFPINALLDWPMGTVFGYDVFSNVLVNQQFKKILAFWSKFLVTEDSRYVLVQDDSAQEAIAWLSPLAQSEMVSVASSAFGQPNPISPTATFADISTATPPIPTTASGRGMISSPAPSRTACDPWPEWVMTA